MNIIVCCLVDKVQKSRKKIENFICGGEEERSMKEVVNGGNEENWKEDVEEAEGKIMIIIIIKKRGVRINK